MMILSIIPLSASILIYDLLPSKDQNQLKKVWSYVTFGKRRTSISETKTESTLRQFNIILKSNILWLLTYNERFNIV